MANIDEVVSRPGKWSAKRRRLGQYLEHEDPAIRAYAEEALRPDDFLDMDLAEDTDPTGRVRVVVEVSEEELHAL